MKFRISRPIPCLLLLLLLLTGNNIFAQYDGQVSQYMLAPGTFNPAVAGQGRDLTISLLNRQQWVGIENAPSSMFLNASMPFTFNNRKHGLGLLFLKESIGLFSTQLIQLQYSYKKPLFGGELSLGLQGGILQQNFDADQIFIPTSDYHSNSDISIPKGTLEGSIPDFSLGIWYDHNNYYGGLSVSHLLETNIKLKTGSASESTTDKEESFKTIASRTFYLTNGYNIALSNPLYTLQPSFLLKTDLNAWQVDLMGKVLYKDMYWGGLGWRYQDAVNVLVGVKLPQGLSIGYSYGLSTSAVAKFSSGSHEVFLGYAKKMGTASVSKKQKSVRIL